MKNTPTTATPAMKNSGILPSHIAGVTVVLSGTSLRSSPGSKAGILSMVSPVGEIIWEVPTVEILTTLRAVSIALSRAISNC
jgi:hypothetical protein